MYHLHLSLCVDLPLCVFLSLSLRSVVYTQCHTRKIDNTTLLMDFYIIYEARSFSFGRKKKSLLGTKHHTTVGRSSGVQNSKIEYETVSILTRYTEFQYNSGKQNRSESKSKFQSETARFSHKSSRMELVESC